MPLTFIRSVLGMVQTKAPTPLLLLLASLSPAPGVDNSALQATLDTLVDREIHRGIVVAIVSETGTRYLQAGDYREGDERPINDKTVIELGATGELFTALLALDLVQSGELDLDQPIQEILAKRVSLKGPNAAAITLRHLLSNTAGLPNIPDNLEPKNPFNPFADYSPKDLYNFLNSFELESPPGNSFSHSTLSEGLAGHLLELAMGSTYDNLLKSRIKDSLGFKYTGIRLDEIQRYRLARGHSGIEQMKLIDMPSLPGVANVRSSAMDLAVLLQIALGIREHNLKQHFVRLEEPEAIEMPHEGGNSIAWIITATEDGTLFWLNGISVGHASFMGYNREQKVGAVVLTNSASSVAQIGLHILVPSLNSLPDLPAVMPLSIEALERYVGVYAFDKDKLMIITRISDRLYASELEKPRHRIYAETGERFHYPKLDAVIDFENDASARDPVLILRKGDIVRRAKKVVLKQG